MKRVLARLLPYFLIVALAAGLVASNDAQTHARVQAVCSVNVRQWNALDAVGRHFVAITAPNPSDDPATAARKAQGRPGALEFAAFLNATNGPRPRC